MRLCVFSALAVLIAAIASPVHAQEARSRPVGYLVQTIQPGQTRSFSIPFDADLSSLPGATGTLTAIGDNYLENAAASWTPGAFSSPEAPYFIRLTSGTQAGRMFRIIAPANTATRVTVADDSLGLSSLGLRVGTRYEILPADTLASFFGVRVPVDTLVLHGGVTALDADLVQVWGGAAWLNFYYNTQWNRWARDTDTVADPSRNSFLLRPDRGVMITRRGSTPLELAVTGRVLATPQRAFHTRSDNALTFLATMQTNDVTLGALALQSPQRSLNWRGAAEASHADLLLVWSGATWFSFFFNTSVGHWQRVGDSASANRDNYTVVAGTPVFVQRRGVATSAAEKTIAFPAPGG
jgi:hypothetical protein